MKERINELVEKFITWWRNAYDGDLRFNVTESEFKDELEKALLEARQEALRECLEECYRQVRNIETATNRESIFPEAGAVGCADAIEKLMEDK